MSQDTHPIVLGVTHQIDSNVHIKIISQQRCDLAVSHTRYVFEAIEGLNQSPAHRAAIIWIKRDRHRLELRPVMQLEQPSRQVSHGMTAKTCRQIGNSDFAR